GSTFKDTGVVNKGIFELKGTIEGMELAFIRVEEQEFNLPIILENGEIKAIINKDSIQNHLLQVQKTMIYFKSLMMIQKLFQIKYLNFKKTMVKKC
ncbi:MAG: DUF4369 domain-containing protein, partial [Flavobacterium sp.]|nr:DUF4369 domain-containing protein [Flavobacterium sp.]